MKSPTWFQDDQLARELSQLTETEFAKFADSDLLDLRPVVIPASGNIIGENDYFMWPIAAKIDETMVVLYQRTPCHWGPDKEKQDENSGVRMVVTSSDGGMTWSDPVDVLQAGRWKKTPFWGFGGGLGVHRGIVYLALNEGVYRSPDKGRKWELVSREPRFDDVDGIVWSSGIRLTFDAAHGLVVWTTSGFSQDYEQRANHGKYGTHLVAVYSPDFGTTWHSEAQSLPDELRISAMTPVQLSGTIAVMLRNGLRNASYGQGYSGTGWFPFQLALTNIGPTGHTDDPDVNFNPVSRRFEVAAPFRNGGGPGPKSHMKVNLYSMEPAELARGKTEWRYDGTLIRYKDDFGKADGFGVGGSVIDMERQAKVFHVWGGDCNDKAGIYQYSASLDSRAVSRYLLGFYGSGSKT